MKKSTIKKGKDIANAQDAKLIGHTTHRYGETYSFMVKQASGIWTNVWLDIQNGIKTWSCSAVATRKDGKRWGCVMRGKRQSDPFCSHTYACSLLLKQEQGERHGRI